MLARAVALLIALATGASGVLPATASFRCLWTGARMAHPCCPEEEAGEAAIEEAVALVERADVPPTTIDTPCCVRVEAPTLLERNAGDQRLSLEQPDVVTLPSLAFAVPLSRSSGREGVALQPRGAPPGDRLHRYSAVLRV